MTSKELQRLKAAYAGEVAEFNAGFDAYRRGESFDDEPADVQYDVWRAGWAWAAFEPMRKEIAALTAQRDALAEAGQRLASIALEACSDLETELQARYHFDTEAGACEHPAYQRYYDRDIQTVIDGMEEAKQLRAALDALKEADA